MELSSELLGTAAVGTLIILAAIGNYLRSLKQAPATMPPALQAIGIEFGSRLQMDQLIAQVTRIADILENKKQAGMEKTLSEIVDRLEDIEERPNRRR
jgi:hypothetical protein